jgi:hypothetical protein
MKGYCYLDTEGRLNYKPKEYIDVENPLFWQNNGPFILAVWKFDTEDLSAMYRMYSRFKVLRLRSEDVLEFSKTINFQVETLKQYASNL